MADFHQDLQDGENHQVTAGNYSSYIAKAAATYASGDVRKVYRQSDDECLSALVDTTPLFQKFLTGYEARVQTTNATETNLFEYETSGLTDYVFHVEARVNAFVSGGGNGASYVRIATFKNDSGTLSQIGSTTSVHTAEDDAAWDCKIQTDGGTKIQNDIVGKASTTINWQAVVTILAMKDS